MVLSTATQVRSTYLLWKRFTFPGDDGPRDAISVPKVVGDQLNAAYSVIIGFALIHIWTIVFSLILYFYMRMNQMRLLKLSHLAPIIWNKRSDFLDLIIETVKSSDGKWKGPWLLLFMFLMFAIWVGQIAAGFLIPPLIILGNAAPANPTAVYAPIRDVPDNASLATLFSLEVPRTFRALGNTAVDAELRHKVNVSPGDLLGQTTYGDIRRIDYSYRVTGTDFGLQSDQDLNLNVVGSCITEYSWFSHTDVRYYDGVATAIDWYNILGQDVTVSLFDGRQPAATFFLDSIVKGTLDNSNTTWAALISSVNRTSFSIGSDPWYLTGHDSESVTGALYSVQPGRPALSCWQDDVWSFEGRNFSSRDLFENGIPTLGLSTGLQQILYGIFEAPMIVVVAQHLQASALLSSTTANEQLFDAGASSAQKDLERLVQAAYAASVNSLTDLTLYPAGADDLLHNTARDSSNQPLDGIADFVVYSPDVASLSTVVVIVVPSVFVGAWVFALILLYWTPVKEVKILESSDLHKKLKGDSIKTAETTIQQSESGGHQSGIDSKPVATAEHTSSGTSPKPEPPHNTTAVIEPGSEQEVKSSNGA